MKASLAASREMLLCRCKVWWWCKPFVCVCMQKPLLLQGRLGPQTAGQAAHGAQRQGAHGRQQIGAAAESTSPRRHCATPFFVCARCNPRPLELGSTAQLLAAGCAALLPVCRGGRYEWQCWRAPRGGPLPNSVVLQDMRISTPPHQLQACARTQCRPPSPPSSSQRHSHRSSHAAAGIGPQAQD